MLLHSPVFISPRLMPAVQIGEDTLSVDLSGYRNGRSVFTLYIDFADGAEYSCSDLSSPRESLQEALSSYLSFLSACGEGYRYQMSGRESENADLFPPHIAEWAYQHNDEIGMMQLEMEENGRIVIDQGEESGTCCKCNGKYKADYLESIFDIDTETESEAKDYCKQCADEVFN